MPGLTVHFEVLNQLATPALYADTLANRPTASIIGRIFFRTDSPYGIYRDNGSSWDAIASAGGGSGITGTLASGQVPYATGTTTVAGTNNLFWDSTNNRLGIGTATPGVTLDVHGAGSIVHINGTGTNNAFQAFQNAGTTKWRIGNNYSAATNYFSIYDFANSVESFKLESGATNILTITATTNNQGNVHIQKAGANPRLEIQQDTASATNKSEAVFLAPVGFGAISKYTSLTTALKIIAAEDFGIYNYSSSGDIAVLNDFATGKIKFAAGGSSTAQATLTAAGRLLLGTTTESTFILDVNGTTRLSGNLTTNLTLGSIPFISTSGLLSQDNSNLFWDNTNKYLGIGTAGPSANLHIRTANPNLLIETSSGTGSAQLQISVNPTTGSNLYIRTYGTSATGTFLGFANGGSSQFLQNDGTALLIGTNKTIPTIFGTNNTERTRITANGRVLIGTTTEDTSALLNVTSTTNGFLPPRMTTTQKNAITTPAAGLIVYDTTLSKLCVRTASAWETITSV